jgi:hypothetical protein
MQLEIYAELEMERIRTFKTRRFIMKKFDIVMKIGTIKAKDAEEAAQEAFKALKEAGEKGFDQVVLEVDEYIGAFKKQYKIFVRPDGVIIQERRT